jgi:hypothetical protein
MNRKEFLKTSSLALVAVAIGPFFSACSPKIYEALNWQSNTVTTDGMIPEWTEPLRFYDDNSKINYTISNNRENLYLCMKISYEATKIQIIRSGMEFGIDTMGRKSFPVVFVFPIADEIVMINYKRNEIQEEKNHSERSDHSGMNQKMLSHAKNFQLVGFKYPFGGTLPLLSNTAGISAAIDIDNSGIMYYEAIIPFRTFYKNELTNADTNKVFCYKIKVNALTAPSIHEREAENKGMGDEGSGMGGEHHGGGGGHHDGMGGEGAHGGEHSNGGIAYGKSDLYVSNEITRKMKFSLK